MLLPFVFIRQPLAGAMYCTTYSFISYAD